MLRPLSLVMATVALGSLAASAPASAGGLDNRDGCGMYSPEAPIRRGAPKVYRYDPRSWYYRQPGFYPNYSSNYWVPRSHMRYRHRYTYYGPKYQYYPAWGYPYWGHPEPGCCRWDWLGGR